MARSSDKPRLPGGSGDPDDFVDAITVESEDVTKLQNDIDSEEARITQEFDADSKDVRWIVKLYQVEERTGKLVYLFSIAPDELPVIDRLRDEYGTGNYKARVYKNGNLHRVLAYSIRAPKAVTSTPASVSSDLKASLDAMANMQREMLTVIKESRQGTLVASDPMDGMVKMATAMGAILSVVKPVAAPSSDPMAMVTMMMKAMEMGRDFAGGGGEGSNFMDLARDAVKAIGPAIAAGALSPPTRPAQQKPTQQKPAQVIAPKQAQVPAPEPTAVIEQEKTDVIESQDFPVALRLVLSQQLPNLINKAARNSDPYVYALFIADNVPLDTIQTYMSDASLVDKLGRINADVLNHCQWFEDLRQNLIEILTDNGVGVKAGNVSEQLQPASDPDGTAVGGEGS